MKFVDQITTQLQSGKGGAGCVSFRKEPFYPRGGPNGGDGGRGGHVIFRSTTRVNTLYAYRGKRLIKAEDGNPGQGNNKTGLNGPDLFIEVPVGTIVKDLDGNLLLDLNQEQDYLFISGGRGGKGNQFFKNSVNQAPNYAQPGEEGEIKDVVIEIKTIADVGIIGFPNAGKSTLVSVLTSARPQVADYPFTTLNPQLGVIILSEEHSIVIADIPGLIKGAHLGQGLGHKFLKHIERTKCFVHLLDLSDFADRDVWQDFQDINDELKQYDELNKNYEWYSPLALRPQLVVFNKLDATSPDRADYWSQQFHKKGIDHIIKISAATHAELKTLIRELSKMVFNKEEL